jgi:hypothetical protein
MLREKDNNVSSIWMTPYIRLKPIYSQIAIFQNNMTEFSKLVVSCIAEWSKRSAACNGNTECLEQSARQLRRCLNAAFPDSKRVELESDKVNYMLSSVFFLANRLSKASQGLAEFDKVMSSMEEVGKTSLEEKEENQELHAKFQKELDDILAKYF